MTTIPTPRDLALPVREADPRRLRVRPYALSLEVKLPVPGEHQLTNPPSRGGHTLVVRTAQWRVFLSGRDGMPVWTVTLFGHRLDFYGDPGATDNAAFRPPAAAGLVSSPEATRFNEAPEWVPIPTDWIALATAYIGGGSQ